MARIWTCRSWEVALSKGGIVVGAILTVPMGLVLGIVWARIFDLEVLQTAISGVFITQVTFWAGVRSERRRR